jgi:hypothetical protein
MIKKLIVWPLPVCFAPNKRQNIGSDGRFFLFFCFLIFFFFGLAVSVHSSFEVDV